MTSGENPPQIRLRCADSGDRTLVAPRKGHGVSRSSSLDPLGAEKRRLSPYSDSTGCQELRSKLPRMAWVRAGCGQLWWAGCVGVRATASWSFQHCSGSQTHQEFLKQARGREVGEPLGWWSGGNPFFIIMIFAFVFVTLVTKVASFIWHAGLRFILCFPHISSLSFFKKLNYSCSCVSFRCRAKCFSYICIFFSDVFY